MLTLLHSEWPKLCRVLAILSAIGLINMYHYFEFDSYDLIRKLDKKGKKKQNFCPRFLSWSAGAFLIHKKL